MVNKDVYNNNNNSFVYSMKFPELKKKFKVIIVPPTIEGFKFPEVIFNFISTLFTRPHPLEIFCSDITPPL